MGTISRTILGGFSGTVGTVVGANWKGIPYIRSRPSTRAGKPTQAQLEHRAKFSLASRFVKVLSGLFDTSFRQFAVRMTGTNSACSYLFKNAITGNYPGYTLNYSRILMSRGDLPNAGNPTASAAANSRIHFAWTDNSGIGKAGSEDTAILVVYCPAMQSALYTTSGATRASGGQLYDVTAFRGQLVETWLGFISADGNEVADSVFTGEIILT
jgi:hypothetical protein